MDLGDDHPPPDGLESREPSVEDLVALCRDLNERGAKYVVIGGFAVRAAGYDRRTMDIDLLVEPGAENEVDSVPIPFASPRLLWRMKGSSVRDKDAPDIHFLRRLLDFRRSAAPAHDRHADLCLHLRVDQAAGGAPRGSGHRGVCMATGRTRSCRSPSTRQRFRELHWAP